LWIRPEAEEIEEIYFIESIKEEFLRLPWEGLPMPLDGSLIQLKALELIIFLVWSGIRSHGAGFGFASCHGSSYVAVGKGLVMGILCGEEVASS